MKNLNELNQKEVMYFLGDRWYKVEKLEWFKPEQFAVIHDWECLLTGNGDHVFWFLLWIYYTLAD